MRKRFRVLLLAALVAVFAVPVGFALSLEPTGAAPTHHATATTTASAVATTVLFGADGTSFMTAHPVPDAAKLLFVGSLLFGLAAAVRKAN